jgi:hypothetical protein
LDLLIEQGPVAEAPPPVVTASTLRRAFVYCAIVFAISRIGISLLGLTVGSLSQGPLPHEPPNVTPATSGVHNLWDGLYRWDARWFVFLGSEGYDAAPHAAAFFPLYPVTIRVVAALPGVGTLGAATLVANLAYLGALVVLFMLTERELSIADARRTVVVLACFPTAFFLMAPYSESLFLLLTLLAFAAVRRDRWTSGALAGAAAALTRVIGLVLIPSFLVEAWQQRDDGRTPVRRFVSASAIVLGPVLYLAWWWFHAHDPSAPFTAQSAWERTLAFPLTTIGRGLAQALGGFDQSDGGYWISDLALTGVVIAALVTLRRRAALSYLVYGALALLIPLSYPYLGRDLVSMSRFVLVVFPAFWGIAIWCRRRWVYLVWVPVSTGLLVWHTMLFMHWRAIV